MVEVSGRDRLTRSAATPKERKICDTSRRLARYLGLLVLAKSRRCSAALRFATWSPGVAGDTVGVVENAYEFENPSEKLAAG